MMPRWWYRLRGQLYPGDLETAVLIVDEPPQSATPEQRAEWFAQMCLNDRRSPTPKRVRVGKPIIILPRVHEQDISFIGDDDVIAIGLSDGVSLTSIAHPRRPWWSPRRWLEDFVGWFSNYGGDDE